MKDKKILITGGTGLVGAYLVRWFRHTGYSNITSTYSHTIDAVPPDLREGIRWEKCTLPDKAAALDVVSGHDYVIHAAGLVSYRRKDRYRLLDVNRTGTAHIVDACLLHDISHLVYIGSIGALGKERDGVTLTESAPWLDNAYTSIYGLSKYLGELEAWRGAGEGLPVSVILPSVILGTGDWQRSSLQLVDRVARKMPFYPAGRTGYVDIRDIAFFIGELIRQNKTGERWLLSAANLTYHEIYTQLEEYMGLKRNFRPAPKWLAAMVLTASHLLRGEGVGVTILNAAYSSFAYDASKSLTLEGFGYRDIASTLKDVALAYGKTGEPAVLQF